MFALYDHTSARLSDREALMVKHIPPGGNWRNIPESVPSSRLEQIREMSKTRGIVRTTYYGRLRWNRPSYTISTYFSRPGNGCFIHPEQDRLISLREGARLQSFRDSYRFFGSRTSKYSQIGNAVPPLLAYAIAHGLKGSAPSTLVDLFSGAGGLSEGFRMAGYEILAAQELDRNCAETYRNNHGTNVIDGDIRKAETKSKLVDFIEEQGKEVGIVAGGPPCQGFSMAGWFKSDDERNDLFLDFLAVVNKLRPMHILMENVQGLLWMEKGAILKAILEKIRAIGYHVEYKVLEAERFGVPQLRRRVFIIGTRSGQPKFPEPVFGNSSLDLPNVPTVFDAISDLPRIRPGIFEDPQVYDPKWTKTRYQRWCTGSLETREFFSSMVSTWTETQSTQGPPIDVPSPPVN